MDVQRFKGKSRNLVVIEKKTRGITEEIQLSLDEEENEKRRTVVFSRKEKLSR